MAEQRHADAQKHSEKARMEQVRGPGAEGLDMLVQRTAAAFYQRARVDPRMLTPAGILTLQRTVGNAAVNRLLRLPADTQHMQHPVQRYIPVNLGGEPDPTMYEFRAQSKENQYTGFSGDNRGWVKIKQSAAAGGGETVHHAFSNFQTVHTEEALITWVHGQGINLGAHPNDTTQARIIELHTEREPCNEETADDARKGRDGKNCAAWLTGILHANVRVTFNVPNNGNPTHDQLMETMRRRYFDEVVRGQRRAGSSAPENNGYVRPRYQALYGSLAGAPDYVSFPNFPWQEYLREKHQGHAVTLVSAQDRTDFQEYLANRAIWQVTSFAEYRDLRSSLATT